MQGRYKKLVFRLIFFAGWILSPLTPWNDALVNVPLSFFAAFLWTSIFKADFLAVMIIAYWLTNGVGLILMYVSGAGLMKKGERPALEITKLITTSVIYTIIIAVFYRFFAR